MNTLQRPLLKKCIIYLLVVVMLFQATGCNYFTWKNPKMDNTGITNALNIDKYYVVHVGYQVYSFKDIMLDSLTLKGNIDYARKPMYYNEGRPYRYIQSEHTILNEVHIYLNDNVKNLNLGPVKIPLTDIKEIRIIEPDYGKTILTYTIGTIGILAGVLLILLVIVVLTKSSCPYIYVNDGESYVFEGEIYGGAIAANLARDDYMPLPHIKVNNNNYLLRLSNELKERQYTDLARLMVINHPKDKKVLLDKKGNPHLIGNPQSAEKALSLSGDNLLNAMKSTDKEVYLFNDKEYTKNAVLFTFRKPANAKTAKLLLNGKNTLWFDYIFGEFLGKFGDSYNTYMQKQSKIDPSERLKRMTDNDFPLSVYVKTSTGWQQVDYLFTVGPLASRDFVVPLDISGIAGDNLEIKIETGFMFWELDYTAIDYSRDNDLQVTVVDPSLATGTGLKDWTLALAKADEQYMAQENTGDVTGIIYKAPPAPQNLSQSVFLHTRGYYELVRDFKGLPQIQSLNKFKTPGYFSFFSREKYLKMLLENSELAGIQQHN